VPEPHAPVRVPGYRLEQLLGEPDGRKVHARQDARGRHRRGGLADGLDHRGVPVAQARSAPRPREIEEPPTVLADQPGALAAHDREGEEPELLDAGHDPRIALVQIHAPHLSIG
jgi:hypothetical protein